MLKLIPSPKYVEERIKKIETKAVSDIPSGLSLRLSKALEKLPYNKNGVKVDIQIKNDVENAYELTLTRDSASIVADSEASAFFAIQTLRQIFENDNVRETVIKDTPDYKFRGVYYDVTRGKIPRLEELKRFVDTLAYFKTNALFLYVEHVFEFRETKEIVKRTGSITAEELRELDRYCEENFIELVPSIATFGHMGEILEQDEYADLRCDQTPVKNPNTLQNRVHTLNPKNPKSIELVKSLISQYMPIFKSDKFHICCDETFGLDLVSENKEEESELFFGFAKQICEYVNSFGKTTLMWSDIAIKDPERLNDFPENMIFVNWLYSHVAGDENFKLLHDKGLRQIVAPSTCSYGRFSENLDFSIGNIVNLADYGYKYGAYGFVNTSWGDCGHPNTWELSMYAITLGAQKSWNVKLPVNFNESLSLLLYKHPDGVRELVRLNELHRPIGWFGFVNAAHKYYYEHIENKDGNINGYFGEGTLDKVYGFNSDILKYIQDSYTDYIKNFPEDFKGEWADEMLIAAEGVCVMAELFAKMAGIKCIRLTDTKEWLEKFNKKWLEKNKPFWYDKINNVFMWIENA